MKLPLTYYGHPILRKKGKLIDQVTPEIKKLALDMLETMYAHRGVGLAAQQVGYALQLAVIDIRGSEFPSQLILAGQIIPPETIMPLTLLNPKILTSDGNETGQEGCLSLPGFSLEIPRFSSTQISAKTLEGHPIQFVATGYLSRALQHEIDHLNGVLFIDRVDHKTRKELSPKLKILEKETLSKIKKA